MPAYQLPMAGLLLQTMELESLQLHRERASADLLRDLQHTCHRLDSHPLLLLLQISNTRGTMLGLLKSMVLHLLSRLQIQWMPLATSLGPTRWSASVVSR